MNEYVVLVPGVNSSELLRTFARFKQAALGIRIVSAVELAKIALMKSGICIPEAFLTRQEEAALIYSFLNKIPYFKAASYADAQALATALRTLREYSTSNESACIVNSLNGGEFPEKNDAIFQAYTQYMEACRKHKKIDTEGIIRRAISQASPFDAQFIALQEYPLCPLEQDLISHLSKETVQNLSLKDLLKLPSSGNPKRELFYREAYGAVNEAEAILSEIHQKNIPLDQCVIAMASPAAYSQTFFDLNQRYNIPTTYGCGIPITNTNPAMLLKVLLDWDTTGYHGIDALRAVILCDAFDRKKLRQLFGMDHNLTRQEIELLSKMAGSLRISYDARENTSRINAYQPVLQNQLAQANASGQEDKIFKAQNANRCLQWISLLAKELECGLIAFIQKFVYLRSGPIRKFDKAALDLICDYLTACQTHAPDKPLTEVIPDLLHRTVCSEVSQEGHLHLSSIPGAICAMRKHLYICGLSAGEFPGNPTENYLLLDNDLLQLERSQYAPTSLNKVQKKTEELQNLLSFAAYLGVPASLSYASFDLAQLKPQNPSSALFNLYEAEHPGSSLEDFMSSLKHADYFGSELSNTRLIGEAYRNGAEFAFHAIEKQQPYDAQKLLNRAWFPSALEVYVACPRHFYLSWILNIPESEPDDPFTVISAADLGTLTHKMMEQLAVSKLTKEQFLENAQKMFQDFLCSRPAMHPSASERELNNIYKMMESAYAQDPGNEVLSTESSYEFVHPCGIKLKGYPDRVEKLADGSCLIADFKTKVKVAHIQDDFESCFQVIVYAWLCEQDGIQVSSCVYRYLRLQKEVTCKYDENMKTLLQQTLNEFKHSIENNVFPRKPGTDNCKYCKMKSICYWPADCKEEENRHD